MTPRRARLDAPGTLHHVIVRGINKRRIVNDVIMGKVKHEWQNRDYVLKHYFIIRMSLFSPGNTILKIVSPDFAHSFLVLT